MRLEDTEYVFFDVETTGLNPLNGDRVIEIAAVKVRRGETIDVFSSLVDPGTGVRLEAQEVNRITAEMLSGAPPPEEVFPRMLDFIGGACLVGHNVKFDLDFLCYELSLLKRKLRSETPAVDTLKMAREFLPHLTSHRLSDVARCLGVAVGETHRALADVELTRDAALRLFVLAGEQGVGDFRDLLKRFGVAKPHFKIEDLCQETLF